MPLHRIEPIRVIGFNLLKAIIRAVATNLSVVYAQCFILLFLPPFHLR